MEWAVYSLYRLMHLLGASRICIVGLRVFIRKFYKLIDLKTSAESVQLLMPLPPAQLAPQPVLPVISVSNNLINYNYWPVIKLN